MDTFICSVVETLKSNLDLFHRRNTVLPAFSVWQLLLKPRVGQPGVLLGGYASVITMINALSLHCIRLQDHRRSPELPYRSEQAQRY